MSEPILKLPFRVRKNDHTVAITDASGFRINIWKNEPVARELVRRANTHDALLNACKTAMKVVSEIADIDSESRAGWAHKALAEAITTAEAPI